MERYKQKRFEPDHHRTQNRIIFFSALLGVSVIALVQLLPIPVRELGTLRQISAHAFSVAIPLLAFAVVTRRYTTEYKYAFDSWWDGAVTIFGTLAALVGMLCMFLYFSPFAGACFVVFGLVGFFYMWQWQDVTFAIQDYDAVEESTPPGVSGGQAHSRGEDGTGE